MVKTHRQIFTKLSGTISWESISWWWCVGVDWSRGVGTGGHGLLPQSRAGVKLRSACWQLFVCHMNAQWKQPSSCRILPRTVKLYGSFCLWQTVSVFDVSAGYASPLRRVSLVLMEDVIWLYIKHLTFCFALCETVTSWEFAVEAEGGFFYILKFWAWLGICHVLVYKCAECLLLSERNLFLYFKYTSLFFVL